VLTDVVVCVNGLTGIGCACPADVSTNAFVELSINVGDWQVNRLVFVIADNGVVDGVKSPVYKAVPLTIRKLETFPVDGLAPLEVAIRVKVLAEEL
jgi:hypothetical protein